MYEVTWIIPKKFNNHPIAKKIACCTPSITRLSSPLVQKLLNDVPENVAGSRHQQIVIKNFLNNIYGKWNSSCSTFKYSAHVTITGEHICSIDNN